MRLERRPRSNPDVDFYSNCFPIEALRLRVRCEGECCRTTPTTPYLFKQINDRLNEVEAATDECVYFLKFLCVHKQKLATKIKCFQRLYCDLS